MRNLLLAPLAFGLLSLSAGADDSLRAAQESLKEHGFYTGTPSGEADTETTGAIRRFQIYKGLEATGTLNAETQAALKEGEPAAAPPAEPPSPAPAAESGDREFLNREHPPAATPPPPPSSRPAASFGDFYSGTPYHNAPAEVQRETLRKAQTLLAQRRFYDSGIDGLPGPETEEALFRYQSSQKLPLTGRLDLETLARLRLLPQARKPAAAPPKTRKPAQPPPPPGSGPLYQGRLPGPSPDGTLRGIRLD